jgi:carboxyl-terminal processing protease
METTKKTKYWLPLMMATCVVVGLVLGTLLTRHNESMNGRRLTNLNKLSALLGLIDNKYVDSLDLTKISEDLIPYVLRELDPHSVYMTAEERKLTDVQMEGRFGGIGVEFRLLDDTIFVTSVVKGGPSERVGLLAGDRIVTIEDSLFAGKGLSSDDVMKRLRGEKGTKVTIGVYRKGEAALLPFTILRDDIPVYSVNARYKIGQDVGYIRIGDFGRNAHTEFLNAVASLRNQGCARLIIDLRGNTGGLMDPALNIANEFLPANRLILYTQGKAYKREDVYSNGKGSCQQYPVVVLVDEWSASSSEILTGALQDNDRAWIVGRRSFGKGLVQQEIPFRDGSAVRLTIARFYIPSGRCIQKPYVNGADESYQYDILNRYLSGELGSRDSIRFIDSLRYETRGGRTVYGGGGIVPDFFVPLDTSGYTSWYSQVVGNGLVSGFAYTYAVENKERLKAYDTANRLAAYLDDMDLVTPFLRYAAARNVRGRYEFISPSIPMVQRDIKSNIARMLLGEDAFWMLYQDGDPMLGKAVEVIVKASNVVEADEE